MRRRCVAPSWRSPSPSRIASCSSFTISKKRSCSASIPGMPSANSGFQVKNGIEVAMTRLKSIADAKPAHPREASPWREWPRAPAGPSAPRVRMSSALRAPCWLIGGEALFGDDLGSVEREADVVVLVVAREEHARSLSRALADVEGEANLVAKGRAHLLLRRELPLDQGLADGTLRGTAVADDRLDGVGREPRVLLQVRREGAPVLAVARPRDAPALQVDVSAPIGAGAEELAGDARPGKGHEPARRDGVERLDVSEVDDVARCNTALIHQLLPSHSVHPRTAASAHRCIGAPS